MGDRQKKAARTGAANESLPPDGSNTVGDGGVRKGVAPLSPNARSRRTAANRFDSAETYAAHAVAVAEDIFNGEPLDAFNSAGKYDDRTLRLKDHELRVEVLKAALGTRTKRLEG